MTDIVEHLTIEVEQYRKKETAYLDEIEELQAQRDSQFMEIERLRDKNEILLTILDKIAKQRHINAAASIAQTALDTLQALGESTER